MIKQLLITQLDYSAWANQRLLDASAKLHCGQVMNMLRSLGKQPPGTDQFSFYLL